MRDEVLSVSDLFPCGEDELLAAAFVPTAVWGKANWIAVTHQRQSAPTLPVQPTARLRVFPLSAQIGACYLGIRDLQGRLGTRCPVPWTAHQAATAGPARTAHLAHDVDGGFLEVVLTATDSATRGTEHPQDRTDQNKHTTNGRKEGHTDRQADEKQNDAKKNHGVPNLKVFDAQQQAGPPVLPSPSRAELGEA
ncbi:hypothetical protein ACFUN8_05860 [Streptomyces sp. NPDC057307]|uniref:hypothetical protein n=1 Tax=Streptomyces sp. NPDC057307 TaxID=3346096 RepID=UPI00362F09D5